MLNLSHTASFVRVLGTVVQKLHDLDEREPLLPVGGSTTISGHIFDLFFFFFFKFNTHFNNLCEEWFKVCEHREGLV